jgi:hypothetical protein
MAWSADVFHTINSNDIQFIAASTNQGYFDNVGGTRRQGLDLALSGTAGGLKWHLTYSYMQLSSRFEVNASSNSTADLNGNILVRPGDHIPLIPRHTGRLVLDYEFNKHWDIGANVALVSGSFLHGNENNANQAGGTNGGGGFVEGDGGFGLRVVNLKHLARYETPGSLCAVVNLLDKRIFNRRVPNQQFSSIQAALRFNPSDWTHENAGVPRAAARHLGRGAHPPRLTKSAVRGGSRRRTEFPCRRHPQGNEPNQHHSLDHLERPLGLGGCERVKKCNLLKSLNHADEHVQVQGQYRGGNVNQAPRSGKFV